MDAQELPRYDRQLRLDGIGTAGQQKLAQARVLIVGIGGLGTPAALYLAGAGIGTIGLIDDDVVSETNLHRQVLYNEAQVGQSKVVQAKARLQALNSQVKIEAYNTRLTCDNAEAIAKSYDMIIDGCDNFATRYLLNDTALALGIPYIYGAVSGYTGQLSVFNYKQGVTYRTLFPDEDRLIAAPPPDNALPGMIPGVIGAMEAMEAVKIITGCAPPLAGKLWTIDLRTLQTLLIEL